MTLVLDMKIKQITLLVANFTWKKLSIPIQLNL